MSRLVLIKKLAWRTVAILAIIVIVMGILIYRQLYTTNLVAVNADKDYLYIPTGSDFEDVVSIIEKKNLLIHEKSFRWTAKQMKYDANDDEEEENQGADEERDEGFEREGD